MLFDTDVLIWALRGNERAATAIDKCQELQISAVSYMELIKGARDKGDLLAIKRFLLEMGFKILPMDENISHRAMIYIEEHSLGSGMCMADALIAATASELSLTICTGNIRHYRVIPGLQVSVFRP